MTQAFHQWLTKWKKNLAEAKEGYHYALSWAKKNGLSGILRFIARDFFGGRSLFEWLYLIALCSVPIILELTLDTKHHDWLGLVSSFAGILCVILVGEGRYSNYLIGTISNTTYLYICLTRPEGAFYGEVMTTLYFIIMQPIGLFAWITASRKKNAEQDFSVRSLSLQGWLRYILLTVATWGLMGLAYKSIHSARPFRDSITDGTNVTGQALQTESYWEQWLFWIATNVFSIYLWWGSNIHMQGMYWVYLINSLYGWYTWMKEAKKSHA